MSKAILVMDMPNNCMECPLLASWQECASTPRHYWCPYNIEITVEVEKKSEWCPLREVPQKIGIDEALKMPRDGCIADVIRSYNACIDEILGGGE